MVRFLTLTTFLIVFLALTQATIQAQDQDPPVAGPDEIIIVGEIDAQAGTDVWAFYFVSDFFSCGHTTTDERSRFLLVVDGECATPLGPAVCWGEVPDWKQGPEEFCDITRSPPNGQSPGPGETLDMGLLVRTLVPGTPADLPIEPVDELLVEVDEPVAAPDEIIFVGEAPAPPGTEITAQYLQLRRGSGQVAVCGTTNSDEDSRFLLVVDASCAHEAFGPVLCWGPLGSGSCQGLSNQPFVVVPRDGRTFDVGLLANREPEGDISVIPSVGSVQPPGRGNQFVWAATALLLAAALLAGVGSFVLRRVQ